MLTHPYFADGLCGAVNYLSALILAAFHQNGYTLLN